MDAKTLSTPPWARTRRPAAGLLRALALALALGLAAALAGCGSSSGGGGGNGAPTAVISVASTTLNKGATLTLDGSGSSDPEGATLTYAWTVSAGTLSSATAAKPTFTAPYISGATSTITVKLVVNDGSQSSTAATKTLTVNDQAPTAAISADTAYNGGETVYLDGSGSTDPDSKDVLTYAWSATCSAGTITFQDATAAKPYFVVPDANGSCTASLTVSDGALSSATAATATFTTYAYTGGLTTYVYSSDGGSLGTGYTQNPFRNIVTTANAVAITPLGMAFANQNLYVTDSSQDKLLTYAGVGSSGSIPTQLTSSPVSMSATPTEYTTANAAEAVAVKPGGTTAYVAVASTGLEIVDLGTSTQLGVTTSANFTGFAQDVALYTSSGTPYALLADSAYGNVWAYDVTGGTPVGTAKYGVNGARSIAVDQTNGFAYVAGSTGVTALSLGSIGSSLGLAGAIGSSNGLTQPAQGVATSGGFLFVADGTAGLVIYQITKNSSTSVSFTKIYSYATPGSAQSVYVDTNYAYVADKSGLYLFNIQIPASASLVANYVVPGAAHVVADSTNLVAYVAGTSELDALDVSSPALSSVQGGRAVGSTVGLKVRGNRLYYGRLRVDDITYPFTPSTLDSLTPSTSGVGQDLALSGDDAYVTSTENGLDVVKIRGQSGLSVVGGLTSVAPASAVGLSADGQTAYVGGTNGLNVVDVSSPTSPTLTGSSTVVSDLNAVAATGNYVLASSGNANTTGLVAFDVSNPSAITQTTYLSGIFGSAYDVSLSADGNTAFLAFGTRSNLGTLDVVDLTSLPALAQTTRIDTFFDGDSVMHVKPEGNDLLVGSQPASGGYPFNNGIVILDASNGYASTNLAGEYETTITGANRMAVSGDTLFMGTPKGYLAVQIAPTLTPRLTSIAASKQAYKVSWQPLANASSDIYVKCKVTVGTCTLGTVNNVSHSVNVTWDFSGAASTTNQQILIAIGNQHFFITAKDRVHVQ